MMKMNRILMQEVVAAAVAATGGAAPAAEKKKKTEVTLVKMTDGREVGFPGKRKVQKETLIDESKIVIDGNTITLEEGGSACCPSTPGTAGSRSSATSWPRRPTSRSPRPTWPWRWTICTSR